MIRKLKSAEAVLVRRGGFGFTGATPWVRTGQAPRASAGRMVQGEGGGAISARRAHHCGAGFKNLELDRFHGCCTLQ